MWNNTLETLKSLSTAHWIAIAVCTLCFVAVFRKVIAGVIKGFIAGIIALIALTIIQVICAFLMDKNAPTEGWSIWAVILFAFIRGAIAAAIAMVLMRWELDEKKKKDKLPMMLAGSMFVILMIFILFTQVKDIHIQVKEIIDDPDFAKWPRIIWYPMAYVLSAWYYYIEAGNWKDCINMIDMVVIAFAFYVGPFSEEQVVEDVKPANLVHQEQLPLIEEKKENSREID